MRFLPLIGKRASNGICLGRFLSNSSTLVWCSFFQKDWRGLSWYIPYTFHVIELAGTTSGNIVSWCRSNCCKWILASNQRCPSSETYDMVSMCCPMKQGFCFAGNQQVGLVLGDAQCQQGLWKMKRRRKWKLPFLVFSISPTSMNFSRQNHVHRGAKICDAYPQWQHISAGDCLRAERQDPNSKDLTGPQSGIGKK